MALLSRDMIREIQSVAELYSQRESQRLANADAAAANRSARPSRPAQPTAR